MGLTDRFRDLTGVAIFTVLYLVVASLSALHTSNWEFVFYIAVVLLLSAATLMVHARVRLPALLLWCLSFWALLHMVGGLVPVPQGWPVHGDKHVFYSLWIIPSVLKYDHIIHAYGFGLTTWLCWVAVRPLLSRPKPSFGVLLLCVLGGLGLGAFNEIVEFIAVLLIPDTNVGGYLNTGWDLVANLVGCVIAAILIKVTAKQR